MSNNPTTPVDEGGTLHTDAILHVKDFESVEAIELMNDVQRAANPHIITVRGRDRVSVDLIAVVKLIQARERTARSDELNKALQAEDYIETASNNENNYQFILQTYCDNRLQQLQPKPQAGEGGEGGE
jgi:hypothetical protein